MMKKVFVLCLVVLLATFLLGCSKGNYQPPEQKEDVNNQYTPPSLPEDDGMNEEFSEEIVKEASGNDMMQPPAFPED